MQVARRFNAGKAELHRIESRSDDCLTAAWRRYATSVTSMLHHRALKRPATSTLSLTRPHQMSTSRKCLTALPRGASSRSDSMQVAGRFNARFASLRNTSRVATAESECGNRRYATKSILGQLNPALKRRATVCQSLRDADSYRKRFRFRLTGTFIMWTRWLVLIALLCSTAFAEDSTTRLDITSDTLTWRVTSNWNFSASESSTEANDRLQAAVWPVLSGMYFELPASSVEKLSALLLDRRVVRTEQSEERPRAYGTQFQSSVTLQLPRDVASNWCSQQSQEFQQQQRSRWWWRVIGISAAMLIYVGCLWWDYATGGWRRAALREVFKTTIVLTAGVWPALHMG